MYKDIRNKAVELTDEDVEKVAGGAGEGDGAEEGTSAACQRVYDPDSTECQNCNSPCMLSKWEPGTASPETTLPGATLLGIRVSKKSNKVR